MRKLAVALVAVGVAGIAYPANALPISQIFVDQVNVFFGTATLYSQSNQFLSSNNVMSVETEGPTTPQAAIDGLTALGLDLANQITNDPVVTAVIPSFVITGIPGFANANGLGIGWDGLANPSPAEVSTTNQLFTQPLPFIVTSDTGYFNAGDPLGYSYNTIVNGSPTVVYFSQVNFYERDVSQQLTATPEPPAAALLASGLLGLAITRRRWPVV